MLWLSAVNFNCKGLVLTEGKKDNQNSSQNCPRGQFAWGRAGRKKFLCLQATSVQEWLPWDSTKKDSPVSLRAWKEFHMSPFMCLLWSRKESEKERNKSVVSLTWNIHEAVHIHPLALSPLLSSALWRLPGNLIFRGKILHSHVSFTRFCMTASERGQIHY